MVTTQTPATAPVAKPDATNNPTSSVPTAPKLTFGEILNKRTGFSVLKTLGLGVLTSLVQEAFSSESTYKESIDATRDAMKSQYKPAGKVLAALQVSFEEDLANADIRQGTTFASWFEEKMDRKLDAGRASQCARVFRKLVAPGHLPEIDYDNVATDWLEKTSKIIDLVVKKGLSMTCDTMLDVVNILKTRSDTGAKQLRLIKNKLEGKETVGTDGKGPELNAPAFVAILKRGMSMNFPIGGHGVLLGMTEIIGVANQAKALPADVAKQLYHAIAQAQESIIGAVDDSTIAEWEKAARDSAKKPELAPVPDFKAWLTEAYKGMDGPEFGPEMITEAAEDLMVFYEEKKRLPADSAEFDAWMEGVPAKAAA